MNELLKSHWTVKLSIAWLALLGLGSVSFIGYAFSKTWRGTTITTLIFIGVIATMAAIVRLGNYVDGKD